MVTTKYFDDFLLYYDKAKILEECNIGLKPLGTIANDPLMDNITIYDTVHRKMAGFSNMLQQLWCGSANPKKHQAVESYNDLKYRWDRETWLYVFLIHRLSGSGASFQFDHGFRNTILPSFASKCENIDSMCEVIRRWYKPLFTSIGNQPPQFPKPQDGYTMGGKYFMCEHAPQLVFDLSNWLSASKSIKTIREVVDWLLDWNTTRGFKRFKFVYTAYVMDIAEYMPELVDPKSHANYGKNSFESLDLMFTPSTGKTRNAFFYDQAMDYLCEAVGGLPYDVEDVLCDSIRYWCNYIPKGYDHLSNEQVQNRSTISDYPKHPSYINHVSKSKNKLF